MTLEEFKKFIKIDFDDDDDFVKVVLEAAQEYVVAGAGATAEHSARGRLLVIYIGNEMYKNRSFTVESLSQKKREIVSAMMLQLELESEG